MTQLKKLIDRIINRVNINLREPDFDVGPYLRGLIRLDKFTKFYAFYGLTPHHPLLFRFTHSSLAGSYFLGKCIVDYSVLYKSDIRGDELKSKGESFRFQGLDIPLHDNEVIHIRDSFLVKTLVHNYSHDPENLEEFQIQNTAALHYANIHGAPVEGCFLGPFSTIDLTTIHDCLIGTYAYVQVGELAHHGVEPGRIWVRSGERFDFKYRFPREVLDRYVYCRAGEPIRGRFIDFINSKKKDFQKVFEVHPRPSIPVPPGATLNHYAVVKGQTRLHENVLVAQRAYLENAWLGRGANAQENCYILNSRLEAYNVTAHGGKVVNAHLGKKVFVGFNASLGGSPAYPLTIGDGTIIMPHTIIDLEEPVVIPSEHLVWGFIRNQKDLGEHSLSLEKLSGIRGAFHQGAMQFKGVGEEFVQAFVRRIEHILEANGAYFDGKKNRGHAQKNQDISFNTIQPYSRGAQKGLYPTIEIRP